MSTQIMMCRPANAGPSRKVSVCRTVTLTPAGTTTTPASTATPIAATGDDPPSQTGQASRDHRPSRMSCGHTVRDEDEDAADTRRTRSTGSQCMLHEPLMVTGLKEIGRLKAFLRVTVGQFDSHFQWRKGRRRERAARRTRLTPSQSAFDDRQCLPENLLGLTGGVPGGGVDASDPRVQRPVPQARCTMRTQSSLGGLPTAPNLTAPRVRWLTVIPVDSPREGLQAPRLWRSGRAAARLMGWSWAGRFRSERRHLVRRSAVVARSSCC